MSGAPGSALTAFQARAPPAGCVESSTSPRSSTAAHKRFEAHDTLLRPPAALSIRAGLDHLSKLVASAAWAATAAVNATSRAARRAELHKLGFARVDDVRIREHVDERRPARGERPVERGT